MTQSPKFRVWAPKAREVSIAIAEHQRAARKEPGGYWSTESLPDGCDYFVRLDGRNLPDPRSRFQPAGVSGPSRYVADRFAWQDQGFRAPPLSAAVIYELHLGTFTKEGTFAAAAQRLAYLVELGVTHVELMPLATFPGRWGWGYDGVALFAPHPAYGTPEDVKRFVASCHAHGLAVLLDVVYNHLGPDGNHLGEFGPYFTERYRTPWGSAVNLDDAGCDEVRQFFIDNARMWIEEYHFDGLRLDAVHALYDESARHLLQDIAEGVHALEPVLGKPLCVIAESDQNDPRLTRAPELGGYGVDAQWSDDFHHALHAVLTGEQSGYYADFGRIEQIARALTQGFVYAGEHSPFRQRRHGQPLRDAPGQRLLGYLQNHDQIGNRARGERIGHMVSEGRARIGAALVLMSPFVPMLFQGEEWGASAPFQYFTDHQNAELADAVRRGRREEFAHFGWDPAQIPDPQAETTFRNSQLDWSELTRSPFRERLGFYRSLIALRKRTPDLLDGRRERVEVSFDESARWLRVQRGSVTLVANLSDRRQELPRPVGALEISSCDQGTRDQSPFVLEPESCYIFVAGAPSASDT
jgi:maltooligosyltrehalose trehalohydrolase